MGKTGQDQHLKLSPESHININIVSSTSQKYVAGIPYVPQGTLFFSDPSSRKKVGEGTQTPLIDHIEHIYFQQPTATI